MRFRRTDRAADGDEPTPRAFDVVVVTDLRFPGGTSSSLVDEIIAATDAGYRIGLLHLANPRLGRSLPVHPGLRSLCDGGRAHLLLPGEPATARLAVVKHPMVLADWPGGRFPVDVDQVLVTVGQVPADRHGDYYDPGNVDRGITEAFGHRPRWAPVSPAVRATLTGVDLTDDDWVEVIDLDAWSTDRTTRRNAAQGRGRIGGSADRDRAAQPTRPAQVARIRRRDPSRLPRGRQRPRARPRRRRRRR